MTSPIPGDPPEPPTSAAAPSDFTIAGKLPASEAFAVHYPGYPSSTDRAVETLGGLAKIAKTRTLESNRLELHFRPEDPYCHPVSGVLRPCTGLLLRISKPKAVAAADPAVSLLPVDELSAEVVTRVKHAYHFEGMADYQHVIPVHAAEVPRKKLRRVEEQELESGGGGMCSDPEDVLMMLPDLFSHKNMPENLVLTPSVHMLSKSMQKGVVQHRWEMDIEPCLKIAFDIDRVPVKVNWEDNIQKDTEVWKWQMAVSKLFEDRPIWPRWSLNERLLDDGIHVTGQQLKRLLFLTGYYFSTGPYGQFWIRKGYDPRKDPESRIYQKVDFRVPSQLRNLVDGNASAKSKPTRKDLCHFRVFPSKIFVCLQLFEIVDDFIQQEIRKPTVQATCSPATGWFSEFMLRTLRTHVSIRFLSLFPESGAEVMLKSKRESFQKSKKLEARSRIWEYHANRDSNNSSMVPDAEPIGSEYEAEDGPIDSSIVSYAEPIGSEYEAEDGPIDGENDHEEEEEELDEYESPPLADEDDTFGLDDGSYAQSGESFPNDYLQDILRGFPFNKDGKDSQSKDGLAHADSSDSEYQIFEQDSDGDDDSS